MKAVIEHDFLRQRFKVWLYEPTATGNRQLFPAEVAPGERWEDVEAGVEMPPSLDIPEQALEALLSAAEGHVAATDATTAHLNDAVGVRDRLLTMVEAFAGAPRPERLDLLAPPPHAPDQP